MRYISPESDQQNGNQYHLAFISFCTIACMPQVNLVLQVKREVK